MDLSRVAGVVGPMPSDYHPPCAKVDSAALDADYAAAGASVAGDNIGG